MDKYKNISEEMKAEIRANATPYNFVEALMSLRAPTQLALDHYHVALFHILFVNEVVDYVITDFVAEMKKQKFFKNEVKLIYNRFKRAKALYKGRLESKFKHEEVDIIFERIDICIDTIASDLQVLEYTIKNEMLKLYDHDKVAYLAFIHIIDYLSLYAEANKERWIENIDDLFPKMFCKKDYELLDIGDWIMKYHALRNLILDTIHHKAAETNNPNILDAFKIVLYKLGEINKLADIYSGKEDGTEESISNCNKGA